MFKPGDKLLCINGKDAQLVIGRIYTCGFTTKHDDKDLWTFIKESQRSYYSERFKLADMTEDNLSTLREIL